MTRRHGPTADEERQQNTHAGHEDKLPGQMIPEHHRRVLWVQPVIMIFGAWLIASPFAMDYESDGLAAHDVTVGIIVIALAALAFAPRIGHWSGWANGWVGVWLLFSPLFFEAPTPAEYANGTIMGVLIIVFAVLIPHGIPMSGPDTPAGWSYNPSTWIQRIPIMLMAVLAFFLARHMAAYQLGHIDSAWDPIFGDGTERVLDSDISEAFPVSDAGLGASVYLVELMSAMMGDQRRWRTMPWMVAMFGVIVVPLGITSIVLIILQPLAVGAWCTFCLLTALFMLIMIPFAIDEVAAMLQVLARVRRRGESLWRAFWLGQNVGIEPAPGRPSPEGFEPSGLPTAFWGVNLHWPLVIAAAIGVWLMFSPDILGWDGAAANSNNLVGALIVVVAMIALAEVVRALRFVNVAFGAWIIIAGFALPGAELEMGLHNLVLGALVILLSLPRGRILNRYGTLDTIIR